MKHNREKSAMLRHHELWFRSAPKNRTPPKRKTKKSSGLHPQYKVVPPPVGPGGLRLHPGIIKRKTFRDKMSGIIWGLLLVVAVIAVMIKISL